MTAGRRDLLWRSAKHLVILSLADQTTVERLGSVVCR